MRESICYLLLIAQAVLIFIQLILSIDFFMDIMYLLYIQSIFI